MYSKNKKNARNNMHALTLASSLAVLTAALSSAAMAQDAAEEEKEEDSSERVEEVVVQGFRSALETAQDMKRDASTFLDAISAEDIGSLPDRSVVEAMQRLPGVAIERFANVSDADHFGVEGSGAVVRGLTATRSEFNGRDSFNASSGYGLNFEDVPPELMGRVELYKNQTADMIEGGIGGTVSLHTRLPFDSDERQIAIKGDLNYSERIDETTPTYSGLFSDRWDTEYGEFGLLLNLSKSRLKGRSDNMQSNLYVERYMNGDHLITTNEWEIETDEALENMSEAERRQFASEQGYGTVYVPNGANAFFKNDDRTRKGYSAALQWSNPEETLTTTGQFFRSDASLSWTERELGFQLPYDSWESNPATVDGVPGEFQYTDQGVYADGIIVNNDDDGWRSTNDNDRVPNTGEFGHRYQAATRFNDVHSVIDDYSLNFVYTPTEAWEISADFQHVEATTSSDDGKIMMALHAAQDFDMRGSTPSLTLLDPFTYNDEPTYHNPVTSTSDNYFTNSSSYYWQALQDSYERSEGEENAFRADAEHFFEDSFITSVKAGVRYAKREQTVRKTDGTWAHAAALWAGEVYATDKYGEDILDEDDTAIEVFPEGASWLDGERTYASPGVWDSWETVNWNDFHDGSTINIPGGNNLLMPSIELTRDVAHWDTRFQRPVNQEWVPASQRDRVVDGYFRAGEISTTEEKNQAAYVRVNFSSDDFALRFDGNFGLRYVKISHDTTGAIKFPDLVPLDPTDPGEVNNHLSEDELGFANEAEVLQDATEDYTTVLPSFNLKLELTDDLISRFAVSKAIAMPDIGDYRNSMSIGLLGYNPKATYKESNPQDTIGDQEIESAYVAGWTAYSGNPHLKPMESIQYDVSLEWYFADVGSLTTSLFYKDLSNFNIQGAFPRDILNPTTGITQPVDVSGPINGGDGTIQGIELAYQQSMDFLPGAFSGITIQANYTYIDAKGVPNSQLNPATPGVDAGDEDAVNEFEDSLIIFDDLPLQGQSEHTFNLVGIYEWANFSGRLAYNWRSEYLLTTRDVIAQVPIFNEDSGFLDGSAFYNITDDVKIGLQAKNLLNTKVKTIMQVNNDGLKLGRSWFATERSVALVLQANF